MRFHFTLCFFLFFVYNGHSQKSIEKTLKKFNKGTVPYITVQKLHNSENLVVLDAREQSEYNVSHLKKALWVGYKKFNADKLLQEIQNKETPLVVYCSIGVRSENIGEKLIKLGYTHVKNLYGGIFEWKKQGYPVFDNSGQKTNKVHAYNKHWGKLLTNADKVYDKKK